MKRRTKFLALLALLLALALYLSVREKQPQSDTSPLTYPKAQVASESQREQILNALRVMYNRPIEFHGIVLDQHNMPVAGATVKASVGDDTSEGSQSTLLTDSEGRFTIKSKGRTLSIRTSKSGYYYVDGEDTLKPSTQGFSSSGKNDTEIYQADPAKPTVFQLRKAGKQIPVEQMELLRGGAKVPRDGTFVPIRFSQPTKIGMKVSCLTREDPTQLPNAPYDWRCEITVENGEIQAANDEHNFTAPDAGYQASIVIDMPKALDPKLWSSRSSKIYWLHFRDGTYGRIRFKMVARGDHFADVEGFRNPVANDRNVEAKVESGWK